MSRLLEAMEIEQEYLAYRMKGEEPYHLVDKITELGYADLTEYFNEKREYEFSHLSFDYIEKQPSECINEVLRMINEKVTGVLFVNTDEPFIFCGNGCDYDAEYCEENGIAIYPIFTNGGCIVSSNGDFSFGVCIPETTRINCNYILNDIRDILSKYTQDVTVAGNDILIDGKKVLGSATYQQNGMFMFVCHVSFVDNTEQVQCICKKEAVKQVGYIDCMSRDEFRQEVTALLLKQ